MSDQEKLEISLPKSAAEAASVAGATFTGNTEEVLLFRVDRTQSFFYRRHHLIPVGQLDTLEAQSAGGVKRIPDYFGFFSPKQGYFEVAIEHSRRGRSMVAAGLIALKCQDAMECKHTEGNPIPSLDVPQLKRDGLGKAIRPDQELIPIHVTDGQGTCIEISPASPMGILFSLPNARSRLSSQTIEDVVPNISVKIDFGSEMSEDEILKKGMEKVNSLLYELSVRNDQPYRMIGTALYERELRRQSKRRFVDVRFPVTSLPHEAAELFSSAEAARDNPVVAFLSFYQVLEYYFPYAIRKDSIRKVRREIVDLQFSVSDDESIMRVISTMENSVNASESAQIAALLTQSVRESVLEEFLSREDSVLHFSRRGPISGVGWINTSNGSKALAGQVAERVYKIRNRIVHAKDDPKYSDVRVLLPNSREAYALQPDIDLVRLLAVEVVADSQI